ncbi:MAG TPA: hypothetical protein VGO58_14040 [Chitinophagaceae bacterium]|jgi:hypothetical protein|nr:hypothetical protein [Chitinophagaceae bacterium]
MAGKGAFYEELRKKLGLTREHFALMLKVSGSQLSFRHLLHAATMSKWMNNVWYDRPETVFSPDLKKLNKDQCRPA